MKYNTAGQQFIVAAVNADGFVSGDAANITCTLSIDGGTRSATNDTNPTEIGTSGRYAFTLTQAETAGHELAFVPLSATSGVQVVGLPSDVIYTTREAEIKAKTDLLGGSNNVVTPLASTTLYFFENAVNTYTLATDDDYSSKTLELAFETADGTDVATIADGSITKTTASISFSIPLAVTSSVRPLDWSLVDTASSDEVLMYGKVEITPVARAD